MINSLKSATARTLAFPLFLMGLLALAACQPSPVARGIRALLDQDKLDAAHKKMRSALDRHPDDKELRRLAIRIHLHRNDRPAAVTLYRRWAKQHGEDHELLRFLSLAVMRWGLGHRDPAVRLAALQGARATDAAPLLEDVANRLLDPDEGVRTWAAVAMSSTPDGVDALDQQLRSPSAKARAVAVQNLGRLAGKAAFSTLSRYLSDPAAEVRCAIAKGLVHIKTLQSLSLLGQLAKDRDRSVRTAAVTAAGKLGLTAGAEFVREAMNDPYLGVRLAAVLSSADLFGASAKGALRTVATGDDLAAALRAGQRLARLGEVQPVLNAIAKGLVDRDQSIREAACNTAGSVSDRVALRLVRRALRDPQPRVRLAAARAILAQGDKASAKKTATSLRSLACSASTDRTAHGGPAEEMESLCLQATELLARAKDEAGLQQLIELTGKMQSASNRVSAMTAAVALGASMQLPLTLLADRAPRVAVKAAIAIYRRVK